MNLGCSDGMVASEQRVSFAGAKLGRSEASGRRSGERTRPSPLLPPTGLVSNSWVSCAVPLAQSQRGAHPVLVC